MFRKEPFPGEMRWALAWIVKYFVTHNVYYVKLCIFLCLLMCQRFVIPGLKLLSPGRFGQQKFQWLTLVCSICVSLDRFSVWAGTDCLRLAKLAVTWQSMQ